MLDGTYRKDIKVKEGYVPQEEVQTYAAVPKRNTKVGIPGLAPQPVESSKAKVVKKATTNAKKEITITAIDDKIRGEEVIPIVKDIESITISDDNSKTETENIEKRIKTLKKKLRQIEEIEEKVKSTGSILSPEQLEKVSKKLGIQEEISKLTEAHNIPS